MSQIEQSNSLQSQAARHTCCDSVTSQLKLASNAQHAAQTSSGHPAGTIGTAG
jgi:hypothetical protein